MQALLLAAGVGSRIRPLSGILTKCAMPVNGRPLLEYWLAPMAAAGFRRILLNLHHLPAPAAALAAADWGSARVETFAEERLLGTGGTLAALAGRLERAPTLLVHADNLCLCDHAAFRRAHLERPAGAAMTMMLFRSPTPRTCGIVELDALGVVRAFHEKVPDPPGDLANAAVYWLEPEVVDFVRGLGRPVVDFSTEVVPAFLGRIATWLNPGYHRDIGSLESLLAAQEAPPPVHQPPRPDPWAAWLDGPAAELPEAFGRALADALDAVWLDDAAKASAPPERSLIARRELAGAANGWEAEAHAWGAALRARGHDPARDRIYLERVPRGFDATAFAAASGFRALALRAGD